MEPYDWNIIVVAHWNRAILSPKRIGEQFFEIPPGTPLEIMVPLDGVAPFQLKHDGVIVIPATGQLTILAEDPTTANLKTAAEIAAKAISSLPVTPYIACGINLRYKAAELSTAFMKNIRCPSENTITDLGQDISSRRRGETIPFNEGVLNLQIDAQLTEESTVVFNYELVSTDPDALVAWLSRETTEYAELAARILEEFEK